ncbi:paired amphipathic helix protein Sin3-like 5 [Brassica napus]|uniref:paired amphipathic helix protein Sin3-like 5 n=1 Tax=Brassica napus TaxID=3708 RepID=UPI0004EE8B05|nr:paired amphipathic helix protein Sin3-like 5 [Brassica napus]
MFGVPSRSQTDKTMIDVAKSKDSQEQHEPVKANTCDCSPVSILKPLTPPETPNKESPTIGSSFVQDKLHPGAAMTTEERAGVTTQKGFANGA